MNRFIFNAPLLAALFAASAFGQDVRPERLQQNGTQEIVQLFKDVKAKLDAIDAMLFDIGAGERPVELPKDSGLGKLLDFTRQASVDVVNDIDRILEIAEEMSKQQQQQQSSSSSQSQSQNQSQGKQQNNPQGQQQQNQPPDQEGQKDEPGQPDQPQQDGQKPEGQEDKPGGEQPKDQEGSKDPKGNQDSEADPKNAPGEQGGSHSTGAGSQADGTERWGELPERVRETFRNQGGDNAPLYYREWIDSYYRHLNQKDG